MKKKKSRSLGWMDFPLAELTQGSDNFSAVPAPSVSVRLAVRTPVHGRLLWELCGEVCTQRAWAGPVALRLPISPSCLCGQGRYEKCAGYFQIWHTQKAGSGRETVRLPSTGWTGGKLQVKLHARNWAFPLPIEKLTFLSLFFVFWKTNPPNISADHLGRAIPSPLPVSAAESLSPINPSNTSWFLGLEFSFFFFFFCSQVNWFGFIPH